MQLKPLGNCLFSQKLTNYNIKACMQRYVVGHLLLQAFYLPPGCNCFVFSHFLPVALYGRIQISSSPPRKLRGEDNLYTKLINGVAFSLLPIQGHLQCSLQRKKLGCVESIYNNKLTSLKP